MSTILKALKKSQQERDRGTVPTLTRVPDLAATQKTRFWAWWAGGALGLNAALLAVLVWWLGASPEPGAATADATSAESALAVPPASPPVSPSGGLADPEPVPPPSQQVGAAAPVPDPDPNPGPEPGSAPRNPPPLAPATVATAPVAPAAVEPQTDAGALPAFRPAPRSLPRPKPKSRLAPLPRTADENPASAPAGPAATASQSVAKLPDPPPVQVAPPVVAPPKAPLPEPETDPDPYASLPVLFQLPHEIQRAIPELPITVHVYDKDPRYRFVIMTRRKYREGDQLGRDLTLEAIAPGGLVLRFRGTRFWFDF